MIYLLACASWNYLLSFFDFLLLFKLFNIYGMKKYDFEIYQRSVVTEISILFSAESILIMYSELQIGERGHLHEMNYI